MSSPAPEVLVSIVNFRCAELTLRCLATLQPEVQRHGSTHVRVVENDSGDGDTLRRAIAERDWGGWASLDVAPRNGGFAYGNNRAIRDFLHVPKPPRFFWLLNPDTEVEDGAMQALLDFLKSHPKAGIAGSRLYDANGTDFPFAYRFPSILSEVENGLGFGPVTALLQRHRVLQPMGTQPQPTDWLPGASMMVRREVFEAIGLLDETFFLYYEETDFCRSAAKAGWSTWHVPQSKIIHLAGGSTGFQMGGDRDQQAIPTHWFDSRRHYFLKNHGAAYTAAADALLISALGLGMARRYVDSHIIKRREHRKSAPGILKDTLANSLAGHALRTGLRRLRGQKAAG